MNSHERDEQRGSAEENQEQPDQSGKVSRRDVLSMIGIAGVTAAAGGLGLIASTGTAEAKGNGGLDHQQLINRNSPGSHPATAISYVAPNGSVNTVQDLSNSANTTMGATLIGRSTVTVNALADLISTPTAGNHHVSVRGYYNGDNQGGGLFYWDAGRAKNLHNGGTIISPTVPWNGQKSTLAAFLAGTGETQPSGAGCWIRIVESSISAAAFGASEGQDITLPMQAASDAAAELSVPMIGGISGILSGDLLLPKVFDGAGARYTGGRLIIRTTKFPDVHNFYCDTLMAQAVWHSNIRSIECDKFIVDGYSLDWGTFWNKFENIRAGQIILDCQAQAVNSNEFLKCNGNKPDVYGLLITDNGLPGATSESHGNNFIGCDFSVSLGIHNATAVHQQNTLTNCYLERGARINGNFLILGMNHDSNSPPAVSPYSHVIGMTQHIPSSRGDMFSVSLQNAAIGGDWSVRDVNNKPPAFSATFGSAGVVPLNTNTPYGYKAVYGGSGNGAFQYIEINFEVDTQEFSSTLWLYCPNGNMPVAIMVIDVASGAESYRDINLYDFGNHFHLLRVSGKLTGTAGKIRLLATAGISSAFTMYLGSVFISAYKGAPLPYHSLSASPVETIVCGASEVKRGIKNVPNSIGTHVDVTVTFGAAFTTMPAFTYSLLPGSSYLGNLTKSELINISSQGATIRIYFATNWSGDLHWQAI